MARVLVTGAAGFTGRYLTQALSQRGDEVLALARDGRASAREVHSCFPFEWVPCDVADAEAVAKTIARLRPEYVIHLAGVAFVGHDDPEAFYRVNLFGTVNLLEALGRLETPPRKTLLASSAYVYGANARHQIDETVCPLPVNHYACSKLAMEHVARTWFTRMPIVIVRPFNYTGRGQSQQFVIPKIVDHFRRRAPVIRLGNIDVSRDFSDVRDVVKAYLALLDGDASGEIVNICSGCATPLHDVLDELQALAGYQINVETDRTLVRTKEVEWLAGSNARLDSLTGFRPSIPLRETLQWMYTERTVF